MTTSSRAALLGILALVIFGGAVSAGFAFDDPHAVLENPVVRGDVPFWEAFARDYWGQPYERTNGSYRPVALLSLTLDGHLGHMSPLPFHLTNVLIHAVVVVAVYLVWRQLVAEAIAFAGAALFAVLAASAEAVQAIVGRADLLVTLFGTAGLLAHRKPGRLYAGIAALCLGLALGSKESGVAVVFAWAAVDIITDARPRLGRYALYLVPLAIWAGAKAVAAGFAVAMDPIGNPLGFVSLWERLFGAARTLVHPYLTGLLIPTQRLYDCSAQACRAATAQDPIAWVGIALMVAAVALPVLLRRRAPAVAIGVAWAALLFLPASNVLVPGPTIYGERLLYPLAPGLSIAIAGVVSLVANRLPRPFLAWAVLVAFGLANGLAVQVRNRDWASSDALFESGLEAAPQSAKVQYNAAWAAFERRELALAETRARTAIALFPDYPEAHALLGGILDMQGRTAEAEAAFMVAGTGTSELVFHYATFLARHGRHDEALAIVRSRRLVDPKDLRLEALEAKIVERLPQGPYPLRPHY